MSMRTYPVIEYGLVLIEEEVKELIKTYNNYYKIMTTDKLKINTINDLIFEHFNLFDIFGNFEGEFENLKQNNSKSFYDDEVFIITLDKFDIYNNQVLYTKYKNEEEIYTEIAERLEKFGLKVDIDYIIKNTGKLVGTNWG